MINTLLINTVINKPSISHISEKSVDLFLDDGKDQIGKILPLALKVSKNENFNDITCLIGPGSFTSIRIGLSLAKGISVAKNTQIKAITTFEYMLNSTKIENSNYILCAVNAGKKNSYFIQLYSDKRKKITNAYEYTAEEINNLIEQYENTTVLSNQKIENLNPNINQKIWKQENIDKKLLKEFLSDIKTIQPVELKALYIRPHYAVKKT